MQLNLTDGRDGSILLCPNCGDYGLHHRAIEIFDRKEGDEKGLRVAVSNMKAKIDTELTGNPSKDRNGLKLYFSCESCDAISSLSIVQHKGRTCLSISYTYDDDEFYRLVEDYGIMPTSLEQSWGEEYVP